MYPEYSIWTCSQVAVELSVTLTGLSPTLLHMQSVVDTIVKQVVAAGCRPKLYR